METHRFRKSGLMIHHGPVFDRRWSSAICDCRRQSLTDLLALQMSGCAVVWGFKGHIQERGIRASPPVSGLWGLNSPR